MATSGGTPFRQDKSAWLTVSEQILITSAAGKEYLTPFHSLATASQEPAANLL